MDNVGLLCESVIKVEEIKVETDGDTGESVPINTRPGELHLCESSLQKDTSENEAEEEELERPAAVFLTVKKEPEDWLSEEEMQDPLSLGEYSCDVTSEQDDYLGAPGERESRVGGDTPPSPSHLSAAEKRPFECGVCKKSFKRNAHLVGHLRFHNNERPYACAVCPKRFHLSGDLTRHALSHQGERPFQCPECDKSFKLNKHLVTHLRSHTGERPFSCGVCGKSFVQNGHLITHSRIHTGERHYECSVCKKTFQQNVHLVSHTRIHTGERPYRCDVCNRGFHLSGDLVRHQRTHTGEKPYECPVCKKRYKSGSAVRLHLKAHGVKVTRVQKC